LLTGLLGPQAIAATTVAVERVVLAHLNEQLSVLHGVDPAATAVIAGIVAEEQSHHDQSAQAVDREGLWFRLISPVVSFSTEAVIWIGMRS
jgi:3-demethoxyubiquinol 3-hydroxylase